ncbi:MAG: PqqD family protein [bacterium]|nr:PqqD family protein [bacterium]
MMDTPECSDAAFRRLTDGGLFYDERHGCIHHLNETAAIICENWRQGLKEEDIVDLLLRNYEVDMAVAADHVRGTIAQLRGSKSPS